MFRTNFFLSVAVGFCWGFSAVFAQTPAAAPAAPASSPAQKNLISNGDFKSSTKSENLWDGVTSQGFLCGNVESVRALMLDGTINDQVMPVSPILADMNNDNKLDIVMMDGLGYLHIYFNQGTKEEAKFGSGELAPVFMARQLPKDTVYKILPGTYNSQHAGTWRFRFAPRISTTGISKSGKKDILIGNYAGEILLLTNSGSAMAPAFRHPANFLDIILQTNKDIARFWGNIFAPVSYDWNGDGREDILVGEGSYSANNIHILLNDGTDYRKAFQNSRFPIAFGDGLEQLTPAVVDYNGDGKADLLVANRTGKIAVYLNTGEPWRDTKVAPPELKYEANVKTASGSDFSLGGLSTIAVGDLNGDGLFDIITGKTNGRIAVAYNKGTKEEPKFDAPQEVKSSEPSETSNAPANWVIDYGLYRGNYYAYSSVIKPAEGDPIQPAIGTSYLKIGYLPLKNIVMAPISNANYLLAADTSYTKDSFFTQTDNRRTDNAPACAFHVSQRIPSGTLKNKARYEVSMRVQGTIAEGEFGIEYRTDAISGWTAVKGSDRNRADHRWDVSELMTEKVKISGGSAWTEVKKEFTVVVRHTDKALEKEMQTQPISGNLVITLLLRSDAGEALIDDVKLVEKK